MTDARRPDVEPDDVPENALPSRYELDRPSLPGGEPVLHRWFVIALLVLAPVGAAVVVWAFLLASSGVPTLEVAERRPPGSAEVTHDRGDAVLNETREVQAGPSCAEEVDVVGDRGAIGAGFRAMAAACQLLQRVEFDVAARGLERWIASDGVLRLAVFELTGVDSSARVEDGRVVVELNARFQFGDAARAAPFIVHELTHLAGGWPGRPVDAEEELLAMRLQLAACRALVFRDEPPRGCTDAEELLESDDPLRDLVDAGYPVRSGG